DSAESPDLSKPRQVRVLDRQRDLKMMAGDGFVVDGAFQTKLRHVADAARILKNAGAGAIRRGAVVAGGRGVLDKRRIGLRDRLLPGGIDPVDHDLFGFGTQL